MTLTKTDRERLTRMEDNQEDFRKGLERVFDRLDKQDVKLDSISGKFDELQGAKKVLFGLTALIAAIITWLATYYGTHHK
jgi:soluble cytochrome b562